jgi:salicylate hydroxylase
VGDAAHATTPHHGAGAGFCIEDAAMLAGLLEDDRVREPKDLEAAFAAYDASRRGRGQWLVQSSRRNAELMDYRAEGVGKDFEKIRHETAERWAKIWNYDLVQAIKEAREDLGKRLS